MFQAQFRLIGYNCFHPPIIAAVLGPNILFSVLFASTNNLYAYLGIFFYEDISFPEKMRRGMYFPPFNIIFTLC
jgi:hypothetical protein